MTCIYLSIGNIMHLGSQFAIFMIVASLAFHSIAHNSSAHAQEFDERFDDWPTDLKIAGTIAVAVEDRISLEVLNRLVGSPRQRSAYVLTHAEIPGEPLEEYNQLFTNLTMQRTDIPDDASVSEWDTTMINGADAIIWLDDREPDTLPADLINWLQPKLRAHIDKGGLLVVLGPHAKVVSQRFCPTSVSDAELLTDGMNFLPNCILETNFDSTEHSNERMLSLIASSPRAVGIGLEPQTALVLQGRKMLVFGEREATFFLPTSNHLPARTHNISTRRRLGGGPESVMIDLTQWRREAIERTLEPFPALEPGQPVVENGSLIIVGGGGMPKGLMDQFIELAGGVEQAKLVFVPCEEDDRVAEEQDMVRLWKSMGVRQATFIHTKNRMQSQNDPNILDPLRDATGIWFGGGRQWNLADSYYGTTAHRLMKEVLLRGGVIGGSSAGASIQARYLARATPIENFRIMAPGYERGGLGFLDGVAIDQHFTQRGRQPDMTTLVDRYPQLLGIGIDESTAITVVKSTATVSGRGRVYFYDRRQPVVENQPDYIALESGEKFDLVNRTIITTP